MLYMTATPLNNPEEITELLSLMYVENTSTVLQKEITIEKNVHSKS